MPHRIEIDDEVQLNIVDRGVGAVTKTNVDLAAASDAIIIGFKVRAEGKATELANREVLKRIDGPLDDTVPANRPILVSDLLTLRMGMGAIFTQDPYPILQAMTEKGVAVGPELSKAPSPEPVNGTASDLPGFSLAKAFSTSVNSSMVFGIFMPSLSSQSARIHSEV